MHRWRGDPDREPVGRLTALLKRVVHGEIERVAGLRSVEGSSQQEQGDTTSTSCLLEWWIVNGLQQGGLNEDEIYNLCMTFLTMGHENIATVRTARF